MDGHAGMAELRRAEEEASRIVEDARKARAVRMKQAKADAASEIETFRQGHMKQLEKMRAERETSNTSSSDLEAKSAAEITKMEAQFASNKGSVVDLLLNASLNVTLKIPEARQGLMKM